MSRIGRTPITVPDNVKINVSGKEVTVEGPNGSMSETMNPMVQVSVEDGICRVTRNNETKKAKSYHGLYRQLIQNMITGVTSGFSKTLLINGVGYRAEVQNDRVVLNLGFSQPVEYIIPEGIKMVTDGPTKLTVSGMSKERVGQVASEIRSIRPPEPYKAKGVRYEDERIIRKVGKAGIK
jgi:large subunit ribosomal protein L6